ncbi:aldo/keto reductase [Sandaracinus amylolyticus]|uniref:NADP-dependent oxidoreductase domain-containing protein n=1 Tax=Sandaracinus amylolyticus TaxID=927083 RepID=A0A0F6SFI3_9BACT|nr:aldo/keto reductase [Sandaracinus amylolyticus]AKF06994.1 Hypothetical protein DB32_004143 [Sandaracinus amylolyticus]
MSDRIAKLALGTVQFGLGYGIANQRGQVLPHEVREILARAHDAGVRTLDTAIAYGDSERVLGESMPPEHAFRVVTKLPANTRADEVDARLSESFARLRVTPYAVLLHDVATFRRDPAVFQALAEHRARGATARIGVSFYRPQDLEDVLRSSVPIDLVQIPFSVVDRRFEPLLRELRARGVEVHARSVFLQGLLTLPAERVPSRLEAILPTLRALGRIAADLEATPIEIALTFVLSHRGIDAAVVGVDGVDHLCEHLRTADRSFEAGAVEDATRGLALDDERILLPTNWS